MKARLFTLVGYSVLSVTPGFAQSAVDDAFGTISVPKSSSVFTVPRPDNFDELKKARDGESLKNEISAAEGDLPSQAASDPNQISDSATKKMTPAMIDEQLVLTRSELQVVQEKMVKAIADANYDELDRLQEKQSEIEGEIAELEAAKSTAVGTTELASADKEKSSSSSGGSGSSVGLAIAGAAAGVGVPLALHAATGGDNPLIKSGSKPAPKSPYADKYGNITQDDLAKEIEKMKAIQEEKPDALSDDGRPIGDAIAEAEALHAQIAAANAAFESGEAKFLCEGAGVRSCGIDEEGLMTALSKVVELKDQVDNLKERLDAEPNNKNLRNTFNEQRAELKRYQKQVETYQAQFAQRSKSGNFAETSMAKNSSDLINSIIKTMNDGSLSEAQKSAIQGKTFDQLVKNYNLFGITPVTAPTNIAQAAGDMLKQGAGSQTIAANQNSPYGYQADSSANYGGDLYNPRGGSGDSICLRGTCD